MKQFALLFLVMILVSATPAFIVAVQPDDSDLILEGRKWSHLAGYDVPESMVSRPPNAGAHGASVISFQVSRKVYGSMIVTVIDRPAVAAFVGWTVPEKYINEASADLRAAFETSDGNVHVVELAAGGGHGLLFHSPDNLDISTVTHVTLYHDPTAKWAR